jgi:hypothetical protein
MIVWNPRRFHLIDALPKGRKFEATYDVTERLSGLSKWRSTEAREDR